MRVLVDAPCAGYTSSGARPESPPRRRRHVTCHQVGWSFNEADQVFEICGKIWNRSGSTAMRSDRPCGPRHRRGPFTLALSWFRGAVVELRR
jgi:hypothetical protein